MCPHKLTPSFLNWLHAFIVLWKPTHKRIKCGVFGLPKHIDILLVQLVLHPQLAYLGWWFGHVSNLFLFFFSRRSKRFIWLSAFLIKMYWYFFFLVPNWEVCVPSTLGAGDWNFRPPFCWKMLMPLNNQCIDNITTLIFKVLVRTLDII